MLIYDGSVVLIQEYELSVWDIPPLQPLLRGIFEVIDRTPRYAIIHSFPSQEELMGSSVLGPWFSSIDPPISFGTFGYKGHECVMLCYTVRSINPSRDPTLPMVFPIKMGMVPNLPTDADFGTPDQFDFSAPLQYCDDELCLVIVSDRELVISLIAPPISLDGPSSSKTTVLFDIFESGDMLSWHNFSWSFCASSGRLVVVVGGIIRIMDFLVPPPS